MRDLHLRPHIQLLGQQDKAAPWLPFAKNQLKILRDHAERTGTRNLARRFYKEEKDEQGRDIAITITIRVSIPQEYIVIEAPYPCSDFQGFILTHSYGDVFYDAYYNDGLVERINPPTGTPRPVPETADRTQFYVLPPELYSTPGHRASQFTGLARLAVGCHHLRGINTPLSYDWSRTHGIVKINTKVNNGPQTDHYWIVEISSLGVFGAPINNSGNCCDSFDVSDYLPTKKELEDNPQWQQYKTTLSLWWAKNYGLRSQVFNILGTMTEPYAQGTPWMASQGWAFSASGVVCRAVTARAETAPDDHFRCNQWQIAFAHDGQGKLTGTLTNLDQDKPFVPLVDRPFWLPTGEGNWACVDSFLPLGTQTGYFPSQDAPVTVYYDGETAITTRWQFSREDVPAFQTPPVEIVGGTLSYNSIRVGKILGSLNPLFSCYGGSQSWNNNWTTLNGGTGTDDDAYTRVTAGFYNEKQSHVYQGYQRNRVTYVTTVEDDHMVDQEFPNFYGLHPDCYFIRPGTPPTLITSCTSTFHYHDIIAHAVQDKYTFVESLTTRTALVLFEQEREAVLMVWDQWFKEAGIVNYVNGQRTFRRQRREYKVDAGDCPLTDNTWTTVDNVPPTDTVTSTAWQGVVDNEAYSGGAQLDLGTQSYTYTAEVGPKPFYSWPTYNLSTFLDFNATSKPTAESNVFAMHGNLYYDDEKLTPTNQSTNALYLLDDALVAVGGFSVPQQYVSAFIGKA